MIKRILVGLAGTTYTPVAIQRAVTLAQSHNAEVTGVTILDSSRVRSGGIDLVPAPNRRTRLRIGVPIEPSTHERPRRGDSRARPQQVGSGWMSGRRRVRLLAGSRAGSQCEAVGIKPRSRIVITPSLVEHDCRITYSPARRLCDAI